MEQVSSGKMRSFWKADRAGLSSTWLIAVFFVLLIMVFSRRPQDLLHAQFYAEDGSRWFAQAYNLGWLHSLLIPYAGSLQLLPRLAAGPAVLVPLAWSPLILNLAGAILQVLPATVLLSSLCQRWGPLAVRAGMAAIYIANANAPEIHVNVTNAQWHLALLAVLLAFAPTPQSWLGKAGTLLLCLTSVLSGPFGVALLPILLIFWYLERRRWTLALIAVVGLGTLAQIQTFLSVAGVNNFDLNRTVADRIPLGASPALLVRIVGDDVVLNSLIGAYGPRLMDHVPLVAALLFLFFGVAAVTLAMRSGPLEFRLFVIFTLILFAAALKNPGIAGAGTRWHQLFIDCGMRYYFFPSLVILWAVLYCRWNSPAPLVRKIATAALVLFVLGAARRWEYLSYADFHYSTELHRLDAAKMGDIVQIPIMPTPWSMSLVKH